MAKYNTTKAQMFATVIAIVEASDNANKAELVERLNHEIGLAAKKSTSKASAERAALNAELSDIILDVLSDRKARTVSEVQMCDSRLSLAEGISNSKVTSLLTALVKSGKVIKATEKKKSYYSIV